MKRFIALVAFATILSSPAWAADQTVTLSVPGMNCPACPFTVKKALTRVDGVLEVEVNYKALEAVVTYDGARTTTEALTEATANSGYPSSVKQ